MILSPNDLLELHELAIEAATLAGRYISNSHPSNIETKTAGSSDASQVVTEVDRESQRLILNVLEPSIGKFDLGLLAEEDEDDGSRLVKDYFWCVDPLDGTLPFIEGVEGYAVAISLINQQGIPQIGVVYNPVNHTCYSAIKGQGVWLNGEPLILPTPNKYLTLLHHRSLLNNPNCERILEDAEQSFYDKGLATIKRVYQGGAIMNAIWGLEQQPAYYFALPKKAEGGGGIWDYAATVCIYEELGLSVTDYNGNELQLNRSDTIFMNEFGVKFSTVQG